MTRAGLAIAAVLAFAGAAAPLARCSAALRPARGVPQRRREERDRRHQGRSHPSGRSALPRPEARRRSRRSCAARWRSCGCSTSRASCDPSSLFVMRIGPNKNRGQSGWVYKVGNRQGTTAASDPSGPFGSGRLKSPRARDVVLLRLRGGRLPAHARPSRSRRGWRDRDRARHGAMTTRAAARASRARASGRAAESAQTDANGRGDAGAAGRHAPAVRGEAWPHPLVRRRGCASGEAARR